MRKYHDRLLLPLLLLACCSALFLQTHAHLHVAPTLSSHMVLQQAPRQATIYGNASPGDIIRITLSPSLPPSSGSGGNVTAITTTDFYGHWAVRLPPKPGGETVFVVLVVNEKTEERVEMEDVLFGEVWLCAGQDNMAYTVSVSLQPEIEGDDAENYPLLRLFALSPSLSTTPLLDPSLPLLLPWSPSSREAVMGPPWKRFSAVCFFFGRRLHQELKVPVGLIQSSYQNTNIVSWSDATVVNACPSWLGEGRGDGLPETELVSSPRSLLRSSSATISGSSSPPSLPPSLRGPGQPSLVYNGMIHPLRLLSLGGIIFYQGEEDLWQPHYYECAFPALIRGYRDVFRNSRVSDSEPLPFGFVQLHSYDSQQKGRNGTDIGRFRLAQYAGLKERNVFLAPAFDLGGREGGGLFPPDKQDVGLRLGRAAMGGKEGGKEGGVYIEKATAVGREGGGVEVTLKMAGGGGREGGKEGGRLVLVYEEVPGMFELVVGENWEVEDEGVRQATSVEISLAEEEDAVLLTFEGVEQGGREGGREGGEEQRLWLRYAYRNNVCPDRLVINQATCGLYRHTEEGIEPLLPIVMEVGREGGRV